MSTFMTKQELADLLRCSVRHIEHLTGEGLPFIPFGQRKKLYRLESVDSWLRSRESQIIHPSRKVASTRVPEPNAYTEYCRLLGKKREAARLKRIAKKNGE